MTLRCPGCLSLKDKRQVIESLLDQIQNQFNVSVAEVDHQDQYQKAGLAFSTVSSDSKRIDRLFDRIEKKIAGEPAVQITKIDISIR